MLPGRPGGKKATKTGGVYISNGVMEAYIEMCYILFTNTKPIQDHQPVSFQKEDEEK